MTTFIKPLGFSEEEIEKIEKSEGRMKKNIRRCLVELYGMPVPDRSDIHDLVSKVGKLPEEYEDFLKTHNGGSPEPNTIITHDNERVVNYFFPIKFPLGYSDGIYHYIKTYSGRIPRDTLPIASAGGGDLVLISLKGNDKGKVFYWDHEFESDDDTDDFFENMEVVANSFNSLLSSFRKID